MERCSREYAETLLWDLDLALKREDVPAAETIANKLDAPNFTEALALQTLEVARANQAPTVMEILTKRFSDEKILADKPVLNAVIAILTNDKTQDTKIEAALKDAEDCLKGSEDKAEIEAKTEALMTASQKLGEKVYEQAIGLAQRNPDRPGARLRVRLLDDHVPGAAVLQQVKSALVR